MVELTARQKEMGISACLTCNQLVITPTHKCTNCNHESMTMLADIKDPGGVKFLVCRFCHIRLNINNQPAYEER